MFKSKKNSSQSSGHGIFNSKKSKRYEKIPSNPLDEFLDEPLVNLEETQNDGFRNDGFVAQFGGFITQLKNVGSESILGVPSGLSKKKRKALKEIIKELQEQLDEFDDQAFLEKGVPCELHAKISALLESEDPDAHKRIQKNFNHSQLHKIFNDEYIKDCFCILINSNKLKQQAVFTDEEATSLENLEHQFPNLLKKIDKLTIASSFVVSIKRVGLS